MSEAEETQKSDTAADPQEAKVSELRSRVTKPENDSDQSEEGTSHLTEEQLQWLDDMCLRRYLRARDWDLDKAEVMLRASLKWRAEYRPDLITPQDIESEAEQGKMYVDVLDKQGRPIIYMKPARDTSTDRVVKLKYLVWILEKAIGLMDASRGVEKMVWVSDFKGTGMRTSSVSNIQVSLDCLHVLLNHYPERLGVAFLVNTPWVFSAFWGVIKPFLNEVTLAKVQFINGKKDLHKILEVIDEEALEEDYGGKKPVLVYNHEAWKAQHFLDTPDEADEKGEKDAKEESSGVKEEEHSEAESSDCSSSSSSKGKRKKKEKKLKEKKTKEKKTKEETKEETEE